MGNIIGQRTLVGLLLPVIAIIASILFGQPPEQALDVLIELVAPIGIVIASAGALVGVVNSRVASGELEPGDLIAVLKRRETVVFGVGLLAWVLNRAFGIDLGTSVDPDILITALMGLIPLLINGYATRSNGATSDMIPGVLTEIKESL